MTKQEILTRLKKVYNKKSRGDVELLASLVRLMDDLKKDIEKESPES